MLKTCTSDDLLLTVKCHDASSRLDFHSNHCVSTIGNNIEHGCYLVFDRKRGKFVRARLASAKLGHKDTTGIQCGRANGHTQLLLNIRAKVCSVTIIYKLNAALITL